jgi:hypothetical protein
MTAVCPEVHELERLLRGDLLPEESAECLSHVEECATCGDAVEDLLASDPFVAAVRSQPSPTPPPAGPVIDLMRRLCALRAVATTGADDPAGAAGDDIAAILAPAEAPDEIGRLGGYRVLKPLGAGGMGVVYLAEEVALRRQVALKVMRPSLANRPGARKRFVREARAIAALEHENIVAIHQVGEADGVPFLAMPLLRGTSLEERLRQGGALPPADVVRLGRQIALGLNAAHKRGLVHRDVKPGNIWIEPDDSRAKLLDFGLARELVAGAAPGGDEPLTEYGTIIGTPAYLAPEQARGLPVDGRADLFSLGCVLYRMCTGRPPFAGVDSVALLVSIAADQPPPPASVNPAVPRALSDLIMRLLAKDPKKRPSSAAEVARRLADLEGTAPATRRRRTWWAVAVAVLLVIAGGGVLPEIIVRIKDKNGRTVAEMKVPEGGSVETAERARAPMDPNAEVPLAPVNLMEYSGRAGDRLMFRVTGATTGVVWGTGPYTLDSALATAAVHAGAVKPGQTAIVTVDIVAPPPSFGGSEDNGVTSEAWGQFPAGAFTVKAGRGGTVRRDTDERRILADQLRIERWIDFSGTRLEQRLPEGTVQTHRVTGRLTGSVWGSGPYTLDSNLGAAAVHAGILRPGETARVKIKVVAAPDSYHGSTAHGVTTLDFGVWPPGAFVFVEGSARPVDPDEPLPDPGNLSEYGGDSGLRLTFELTGSRAGVVWGAGPYTLDSRLAAAAVHAGVLKAGETGKVTVELLKSPSQYEGTTANGVTSRPFGLWPDGAFKFRK